MAGFRCHAQRFHATAFDLAHHRGHICKKALNLPTQQIGNSRGHTVVGNVQHVHPRGLLQLQQGQMRNAAFTGRANRSGLFFGAGGGYKFGNVFGRVVDIGHKHFHVVGHERHGRKVFLHVVGQLGKQRRVDGCSPHTGKP